jgi:hypothetical protein
MGQTLPNPTLYWPLSNPVLLLWSQLAQRTTMDLQLQAIQSPSTSLRRHNSNLRESEIRDLMYVAATTAAPSTSYDDWRVHRRRSAHDQQAREEHLLTAFAYFTSTNWSRRAGLQHGRRRS